MNDKIITVKPVTRTKGFKKENIIINNTNSSDHIEIKKKIDGLSDLSFYNLSVEDKLIIKKIIDSYKNFFSNNELKNDEMILTGHEILEAKKIEKLKFPRYLVYRYKYNIYPKIHKVGKYPPCVQIEPTSFCNFRCVMCYQADKSFSNKSHGFMGFMNLDLFKKITDELEGNVEAVTFASRGEPTLNKDFIKILEYASSKFLALKMNTNASMLNEKMIHSILSSDLQTIVFSIDEKDKDAYEKIRINGNFERIIKNLEKFDEIRTKYYSRDDKIVRISGVKINENQNVEEMKKKWGTIADIVAFTNYIPWESSYDNDINNVSLPCSELWTRLFVWYDGKVNPCDYDYKSTLSKWSIYDQSIMNIWNSDEYNYLREKHLNNERDQVSPCNRCINA